MANNNIRNTGRTGTQSTVNRTVSSSGTTRTTSGTGTTRRVSTSTIKPESTKGNGTIKSADKNDNNSGVKKSRRATKKQIRRTIAGLFMATAITVAAIPTPEAQAIGGTATDGNDGSNAEWVKVLNYTSYINQPGTWETTADGRSDFAWNSSVPYVNPGNKPSTTDPIYPIYTTSTAKNDVQYRFAFVPSENGSGINVAVILGANTANVQNHTLVIDPYVDGFKKYSFNTSVTKFCAVSMDDSYLYYPVEVQRQVGTKLYYKVVASEYVPSNVDATYGDIPEGYSYTNSSGSQDDPEHYSSLYEAASSDMTYLTVRKITPESYEEEEQTGVDTDGNPIMSLVTKWRSKEEEKTYSLEPSTQDQMAPCFDADEDYWSSLFSDAQLFYYSGPTPDNIDLAKIDEFSVVGSTNSSKLRIHDVAVWYIGRQYVEEVEDGVWKIQDTITAEGTTASGAAPNPERGIFAGNKMGNITKVVLPDTLEGIGDCAFYGSKVEDIEFAKNGKIKTIGNSTFANCINLKSVTIDIDSKISIIGRKAFENDRSLTEFTIPANTYAIGDYAFAGCKSLNNIDLTSKGKPNPLNAIGYHAFQDCVSLGEISFPEAFIQDSSGLPSGVINGVPIGTFTGCTSLETITVRNNTLDIYDGYDPTSPDATDHLRRNNRYKEPGYDDCDIDRFIAALDDPDEFLFEGPRVSTAKIHETAKDHTASYKYLDEDLYERVVDCTELDSNDLPLHQNAFVVNKQGEIVEMQLENGCKEVVIPESIGKIHITTLKEGSFEGKCFLESVYIPASISNIEQNAFKGCHRLKNVFFTQPENPSLVIADGAFDTQSVDYHESGCSGSLETTPVLNFIGTVSDTSAPFQYAMNPDNNINVGAQTAHTYITFYSGWDNEAPTFLTVQYDYDTQKNTLIDYLRYEELSDPLFDWSKYPFMTALRTSTAQGAATKYEAWEADPAHVENPSQTVLNIVSATKDITLPSGVEAIKTGLFSNLKENTVPIWEGEAAIYVNTPGTGTGADEKINSITMYTVEEIEPYAFANCTSLTGFYQNPDGCTIIGDYAFRDSDKLTAVELASTVSEFGVRPFMGCEQLETVGFANSSNFVCNDSIIYGLTDGNKTTIMECLEGRGRSFGNPKVGPEELSTIKSMANEAFMDCDGLTSVDLSSSSLDKVSERAFALTDKISEVTLPESTCRSISKGAFWNSALAVIRVPSSVSLIAPDAFHSVKTYNITPFVNASDKNKNQDIEYDSITKNPTYENESSGHPNITAIVPERGEDNPIPWAMEDYAGEYYYINTQPYKPTIIYTVTYFDTWENEQGDIIGKEEVIAGEWCRQIPDESALKFDTTTHRFDGWDVRGTGGINGDLDNVTMNLSAYTKYVPKEAEIWTLTFIADGDKLAEYEITDKQSLPPTKKPVAPDIEGQTFKYWKCIVSDSSGNKVELRDSDCWNYVEQDRTIIAVYSDNSGDSNRHKVVFYDNIDGTKISEQYVNHDAAAVEPQRPSHSGYVFSGWFPADFSHVVGDMTIVGIYVKEPAPTAAPIPDNGGGNGGTEPAATATPSPTPKGSGSSSSSSSDSGSNSGDNTKKYTVTVSGGSGTGSYAAGAIVPINAYDMGSGQSFDKWTTSTAGVGFANATSPSTYFVMPANNVAVTATYKAGGSGSASTSGSGGSGSGTKSGTANPSGQTTVDITKSGISNRNVAGATVTGSTDNFIVKITDDQHAADMALQALQNAFGDITRVKYLPMDISLYDSTGRTKITDTQGLAVGITMPLPDELAQYAGNNKIASVEGGTLDNLNSRFTTVDGVPCISFTATHFSPYVIYVDTANLTETTIDYTPKTGDPIHPKWFLSIGLAAVAVVLFFKKDKRIKPTTA